MDSTLLLLLESTAFNFFLIQSFAGFSLAIVVYFPWFSRGATLYCHWLIEKVGPLALMQLMSLMKMWQNRCHLEIRSYRVMNQDHDLNRITRAVLIAPLFFPSSTLWTCVHEISAEPYPCRGRHLSSCRERPGPARGWWTVVSVFELKHNYMGLLHRVATLIPSWPSVPRTMLAF